MDLSYVLDLPATAPGAFTGVNGFELLSQRAGYTVLVAAVAPPPRQVLVKTANHQAPHWDRAEASEQVAPLS